MDLGLIQLRYLNKLCKNYFLYNLKWLGQNILQCSEGYIGWSGIRLQSLGESAMLVALGRPWATGEGVSTGPGEAPSKEWPEASRQAYCWLASVG